jgi:hypothetical protein
MKSSQRSELLSVTLAISSEPWEPEQRTLVRIAGGLPLTDCGRGARALFRGT